MINQDEIKKCNKCGAPIVWVEMVPSGKKNPLNPEPTANGKFDCKRGKKTPKLYAQFVRGDARGDEHLYESHFDTCSGSQKEDSPFAPEISDDDLPF